MSDRQHASRRGHGGGGRICVYAVVSGANKPLRGSGVGGERLRRARVAGIDLIVGPVARLPRPTTAALRRYDAAVRSLAATHDSVLPARYGTCATTVEELTATVRDRRDAIRGALRIVRHRVQMTVRVFTGAAGVPRRGSLRESDSGSEPPYEAAQGRRYLQRRAAEMQMAGAEPLQSAVRKWVRAEHIERLDRGRLAGSIYHLVPRSAVLQYRAALERAARAADLTIVISGPWPPYAFAQLGHW